MNVRSRVRRLLRDESSEDDVLRQFVHLTDEDRVYMRTLHDERVPLPEGAREHLRGDHPRLRELREAYANVDAPVRSASRWTEDRVEGFLDLPYFRGETLITWHYRELPRINALKYFVLLRYVRDRDTRGLVERLGEDGLFGCWTYDYEGYGRVSRDLLESVNELCFLDRALGLGERDGLRVLDIGAGYGRLAHRMTSAFAGVADYCCVDAIPESTFLSEYYLHFREVAPPARVVPLHEVDALAPDSFDLAVNIHSFSECTLDAIGWWVDLLARLRVPNLLVIPNEPDALLSLEPDGERRDFAPLLERAGYEPRLREPVLDDPAVRSLVGVEDTFHLFALRA
jgi:SAM-dependent methyltransferase